MKRVITALFAFLITTSVAHATVFNLGPRLGGSISHLKVGLDKDSPEYEALNLKSGLGYHLGIFARFSLSPLYIQPELLFSGAGAKFDNTFSKETKLCFTKLDLPAMLGLSFFNTVRVQVGPVFSLLLNALEEGNSAKEHYEDTTLGWQAGVGVDIWNIVIDFKYEGNLSRFGDKVGKFSTEQGYELWILSIGFKIF